MLEFFNMIRESVLAALTAVTIILWAHPGSTQPTDDLKALGTEIKALKEGQKAIERDLQQVRVLLQAGPLVPPSELDNVVLSVEGAWDKGEKTARLTIIEFVDYQCPICSRHFREVLPQIEAEYIKTGKVRYVIRDYPLEPVHQHALKAAEAARCAGDQGKYWEIHDRLLANQRALGPKDLPEHARALGLHVPSFQECLDSGRYEEEIRKDIEAGLRAGVRGTPTFFLGLTEANDAHVKALRRLPGAVEYVGFKSLIDRLLRREN